MTESQKNLQEQRDQASKVHGQDPAWAVFKHNFSKLICCDMMSRAFVWLVMAWLTAIAVEFYSIHALFELNMWVELGLGAHAFLAAMHWAARNQFKLVIQIARERWGKPNAPDV